MTLDQDSESDSSAKCSCLATCVNVSEAQDLVQEVIEDLLSIRGELQLQLTAKCIDLTTRACKISTAMVRLQNIDSRLNNVINSIQSTPEKEVESFDSNFGISVKLDIAQDKLRSMKKKHNNLRKEWYSQNEHLNKLSYKLKEKERELRHQSVFCTAQGLILSKMLWKLSKTDTLLDIIVSEEKLAIELIQVFAGCLYGFMHTFGNEMPEPSTDEYQYVLCLCGVFSNLATTPDGRFLLISQSVCREVYDEIIKILPKVLVPNAENLKWIMLSAIYNLMICKEGEEYAKNNCYLLQSLAECIKPPHPNRIILLSLQIISSLTNKIPNEQYMVYVSTTLPMKRLRELEMSTDSMTIRTHAKQILGSVMKMNQQYKCIKSEKLLGVIQLDQSRSIFCPNKCTNAATKNQRNVLAYHVLHRPTSAQNETANTTCSSDSQSDESSSVCSSRVSDTPASVLECSASSGNFLNCLQREPSFYVTHECKPPIASYTSRLTVSDYISTQFVEQATSTGTGSTVNTKIHTPEKLVQSTEVHSEGGSDDEIQCFQYQLPYTDFSKNVSVTIGDNAESSGCHNITALTSLREGTSSVVGDSANTSIVTVYQISGSRAILFSQNSFIPVCTQTSNNELPISEISLFKDAPSTDMKEISSNVEHATSSTKLVDADGRPWYEYLKSAWQNRTCIQLRPEPQKTLDMPSTSTDELYEFERPCPYVVPMEDEDQSSTSTLDCGMEPENKVRIRCKSLPKWIKSKNSKNVTKHKRTPK